MHEHTIFCPKNRYLIKNRLKVIFLYITFTMENNHRLVQMSLLKNSNNKLPLEQSLVICVECWDS